MAQAEPRDRGKVRMLVGGSAGHIVQELRGKWQRAGARRNITITGTTKTHTNTHTHKYGRTHRCIMSVDEEEGCSASFQEVRGEKG